MIFSFQGGNVSQLERDIGSDQFPPNEHYFGLVNVCIYCYFIIDNVSVYNYYYATVWQHVLQQLGTPSVIFLPSIQRESARIQS